MPAVARPPGRSGSSFPRSRSTSPSAGSPSPGSRGRKPFRTRYLGDLKLAVTEACTNSVRHAYAGGEGIVEILYELHADCVVIEVSDSGRGFAPSIPAVARQGNGVDGGLGLAIIDSLADELEISERPGGGSSSASSRFSPADLVTSKLAPARQRRAQAPRRLRVDRSARTRR